MSLQSKLAGRYDAKRLRSRTIAYYLDLLAFAASIFLAFQLRFDGDPPAVFMHTLLLAVCVSPIVKSGAFLLCSVNRGYWQYTSLDELVRIVWANSVGSIFGGSILLLLNHRPGVPRSIYVLDWLISCSLTLGGRIAAWAIASTGRRSGLKNGSAHKRTLIYGAGDAGLALMRELQQNRTLMCEVVGFIDDDPRKLGLSFHGKKVLGAGESLPTLVADHAIDMMLIAVPSATGPQMVRILKFAIGAEVGYKTVPGLGEIIHGHELGKQIRDVAVEDLLGRQPVELDQELIRAKIQGKVVMVTGAAGSIGSEICRQLARFHPAALIGLDEAETPLFQLDRELHNTFPRLSFHPEIGNVRRPEDLRRIMLRHQPSIVYHAAAYKHVPLMERHVFAAIENNVFGTWNVALASMTYGVEDFVMISSDKAVRPTSMMGATKRAAELVIRALQMEGRTRFVSVRFGNVLGSNGSVVPIFKEQIAAGGPVTVTHPEMRRYFMTVPEASQLVLQSYAIGKGGEVFVLDMGEPIKIVDLATNLIMLSGLRPELDIKLEFTGLRPGEKLFEELNLVDESLVPTSHTKIRSFVSPVPESLEKIRGYLQELRHILEKQDVSALVLQLKELIPDYNPGSQLLRIAMSVHEEEKEGPMPVPLLAHHAERMPRPLAQRPASSILRRRF